MASPQQNLSNPCLKSPPPKPIYPSMEEGFIPLSFSSPRDHHTHGNTQRYSNNYKQRNQRNRGYQQREYNKGSKDQSRDYRNKSQQSFGPSQSDNINKYIHPSMLEDPWKDLVEKEEQRKLEQSQNNFVNPNEDENDSGEDSGE